MTRLAVLLACLCLAGCFYSDDPLIGRFQVDLPLEPGVYSHTPYDETGAPWPRPTWEGRIQRRGGRYVSDVPDFPHNAVRLREIADGTYAAMAMSESADGRTEYGYGLVFLYPGNIATYHNPDCSALSADDRSTWSITRDEDGFCKVESWASLEAALVLYLRDHGDNLRIDGVYRRIAD